MDDVPLSRICTANSLLKVLLHAWRQLSDKIPYDLSSSDVCVQTTNSAADGGSGGGGGGGGGRSNGGGDVCACV